ncbi:MAG TPA: TlpA disulfide reductase family protein [Rhodanobacter sp.]|nr:TlpA disulfide reductase family protein [Rhodanobacter sp.]
MRRTGLVLVAMMALQCCFAANAGIKPGDTPPDSLGTTLDGQTVSLASLHGKVVVISFWATWCGYCMKEMPVLAGLQSLATARKLPLQVVSVDYRETHDTFRHSVRVLQKRLPNLLISWDRRGTIGAPYGTAGGIPVMVMLHRDGTVASIHIGYGEDMLESLVAEINGLLNEPAPASKALAAH